MATCVTGLRESPTRLEVLVSHAVSVAVKLVASYGCRGAYYTPTVRTSVLEKIREELRNAGVPPDVAESVASGVLGAFCDARTIATPCTGVLVGTGSSERVAHEIGTIVAKMNAAMAVSVMLLSQEACKARNEIAWLLDATLPDEGWFASLARSSSRPSCERSVVSVGYALIPRMLDLAMRLAPRSASGVSATLAPTELETCAPGAPSCARSGEGGANGGAGFGAAIAILFALDNTHINAGMQSLLAALARYVCESAPSERTSLRRAIIDTVTQILSEGCAKIPEQIQSARPHG